MKKLIALFVFFSVQAFATPHEILMQQMRSDNTQYDYRFVQPPSTNSVLLFDSTTNLPIWADIATNFTYSSGIIIPSGGCQANWSASSGCTVVLNKPTLGTASALNVPASGNAASGEVVKGNDGRLTDSRAPTGSASGDLTGSYPSPVLTTTGISSGTYSGLTVDTKGRASSGTVRSFNYTTRALNTCFQVSSTRDAQISYSVDILTTITLAAGQQGTVYLRSYTNSSCTTGVQELVRFVNGQTGSLTVGLNLSQNVTATLTGLAPAGAWLQLVTENNTGTPTFTARPGQEVLL